MVRLDSCETMCEALKRQGQRYAKYRSRVPEGERGQWKVEKFKVEIDLCNLRMIRDGRGCSPGIFTKLTRNNSVIMSDTDAEIEDFLPFVRRAKGRVLVAGLGLGLVTQCLLNKTEIEHLTVVEIDSDVIELIKPHLRDDRLNIEHGSIFDFKTGKERFDFGWYDIWDNICGDNVEGITKLKRKFAKKVGQQFAWCEHECRRGNR